MGVPAGTRAQAPQQLVRGFNLLRCPLGPGSPLSRGLLVKRHEGRTPAEKESSNRTLFVTHVDNFVTEARLSRCFASSFGPVERVELKTVDKKAQKAEQRADGVSLHVNFARVVFQEAASLEKALQAATGKIISTAVLPLPAGTLAEEVKAAKTFYREPGELRREVDTWMAGYDEREEEKKRAAKETAVDDDGFTKVVSGITRTTDGLAIRAAKRATPKTGAFSEPIRGQQEETTAVLDDDEKESRKRKRQREMPDFYRFQLREKRREDVFSHRQQHAEDEKTVYHMKKAKKFKAEKF